MRTIALLLFTTQVTTQEVLQPHELVNKEACGGFSEVVGINGCLLKCEHIQTKQISWRDYCE